MSWTYNGASFEIAVQNQSSPIWTAQVDATTRQILGTTRFERSWRTTMWVLKVEVFIEAGEAGAALYASIVNDHAFAQTGSLSDGTTTWLVSIMENGIVPLDLGQAGYRGSLAFGRVEG